MFKFDSLIRKNDQIIDVSENVGVNPTLKLHYNAYLFLFGSRILALTAR